MKTFGNIILFLFLCPGTYMIMLLHTDKDPKAKEIRKTLYIHIIVLIVLFIIEGNRK